MKGKAPEMKKPRSGQASGLLGDNVKTAQEMNVAVTNQEKDHVSKNSTAAVQIVPFRQAKLLLVDRGGEPFVPMKPVVEGMGMAWQPQHRKLLGSRFSTCITEMVIQVQGDSQGRPYTCLPLRKLPGWLMSIHPEKIKNEDRRKAVVDYQNECDDVLWAYWNEGLAVRNDDRTLETVLNSTIGTDGFHMLGAVLNGKVRHLPAKARQRAKMHVWSQVHKAFSVVSAEDIPASSLDAARNFIGSYSLPLEGEWLGKASNTKAGTFADILGRPLTPTERWMVYTDHAGNEQYKPVPFDACVLTHRDLIKGMLSGIPVSTEEMFEFAMAVVANLKIRHDHQASLVKAGRVAA